MIYDGAKAEREAFADGLQPDPIMTVCEWAEGYRILPQAASAEPGPFRVDRTPYVREPIDCLSVQSPVREVSLMWAAQVAKTEGGNNWVGSIIHLTPGPTLAIQPTVDMAKRYSKQRIATMIDETPELQEKVGPTKSRDSSNTQLQKDFEGGTLVMTGANSATGLRSMPVKNLFGDEIDAWPGDVDGEGDPMDLAERRTSTYEHTRKILWTSTPTIAGASKIEAKYFDANATQEVYLVPCPHCQHEQRLIWEGIKYEKDNGRLVGEVKYKCKECEELIDEYHKEYMLANGRWKAMNEHADGSHRSFHLSSLYSPLGWFSWKRAAELWLKAQGNTEKLRTFVNTVLGEVFKEKGETPDWEKLYRRRSDYKPNTIPHDDCMVLTAGVDVQGNRLEVEIVGWGPNMRSWSIDYRVIPGDIQKTEVWDKLEEILGETWTHPQGMPMKIRRMCVDAGYQTQRVYSWVRTQPKNRVMAIQGGADTMRMVVGHPTVVDVNWEGKKHARGAMVWPVGVSMLKHELYGFLSRDLEVAEDGSLKYPRGWADWPGYDQEYFKQLCSEELRRKETRGFHKYEWHKIRERNEPLDCRNYARAGADVEGVARWNEAQWTLLRTSLGVVTSKGGQGASGAKEEKPERDQGAEKPPDRTPTKPKPNRNKRPYKGYWESRGSRWRGR